MPNIPLYLISLLSSLISPSINEREKIKYQYNSARDVYCDLHEADRHPEIYLRLINASEIATRPLQIRKDSFYGRLSELSMVQQSLQIMMNSKGQPVIMSVSGHAGAGKTTLPRQIVKPITESNGFVIRCNFDRTLLPDTVIAYAFNLFFGNLLTSDNKLAKESIKRNINDSLDQYIE